MASARVVVDGLVVCVSAATAVLVAADVVVVIVVDAGYASRLSGQENLGAQK